MKKTTQKLLISTMALSLLTGGAVFADEAAIDANPVIVKPQTEADVQTQPELNGAVADGVSAETLNGVSMIPLRAVAEEFGYTVTWNQGRRLYSDCNRRGRICTEPPRRTAAGIGTGFKG